MLIIHGVKGLEANLSCVSFRGKAGSTSFR